MGCIPGKNLVRNGNIDRGKTEILLVFVLRLPYRLLINVYVFGWLTAIDILEGEANLTHPLL